MSDPLQKSGTHDWRWLILLALLTYALLVCGIPMLKIASEKQLLQGFGVAALDHPFMDMRGVAAWCEAAKEGVNPAVMPTWIRLPGELQPHPNFLMNYSPQVLLLGKLGLSAGSVVAWGSGLALLYLLSLWMLCGECSFSRALLWALLICSPASILVVERGNLDILLFALLVCALLLRKYPCVEVLCILGAASLKFFPIASLCAPWKEGKAMGRIAVLLAALGFLLFLASLHAQLASIMGSLSVQSQSAFGSTTLAELLSYNRILSEEGRQHLSIFLKVTALFGLGSCFFIGYHLTRFRDPSEVSERSQHAFFLSAPIMLGLFVLGPQMDYKWIFFLFMVPAVLDLVSSSFVPKAIASKAWLLCVALYSWWTFFSDEGSLRNALLKQVVMWSVMLLSAFLAGSLWNHKITKKCPKN